MGLVLQALGFASEKLGEVWVGFAKFWDEESGAQDFFCSAPTFSELLLLLWCLSLCGLPHLDGLKETRICSFMGEGDKKISKACFSSLIILPVRQGTEKHC